MNVLLFDTLSSRMALKPFSDTRPIATIRLGIHTLEEKWKMDMPGTYSFVTANYLNSQFPATIVEKNLCINGSICPNPLLVAAIKKLQPHEILLQNDTIIAFWCGQIPALNLYPDDFEKVRTENTPVSFTGTIMQLRDKWDIFLYNAQAIQEDFQKIKKQKTTQQLQDPYTICYHPADIWIEEGATIKAAVLNAETGPIYIGKNAIIEERVVIKGPVAICEGTQVKVGSYIYQGTTLGPYAKVGGEVCSAVIFEYSNKAHGGFLGHSVIGAWCNIGAYTTTSNLRNDYNTVTVWDIAQGDFIQTNLQFCGLFMGDYSKCGIHTMFNTGTVVGIGANLFGTGFFKRFIHSFAKGSPPDHLLAYELAQVRSSVAHMMARRNKKLTELDTDIMNHLWREAVPGLNQ